MNTRKLIKTIAVTLHDDEGHCSDFVRCEARKSYEDVSRKIVEAIKQAGFHIEGNKD